MAGTKQWTKARRAGARQRIMGGSVSLATKKGYEAKVRIFKLLRLRQPLCPLTVLTSVLDAIPRRLPKRNGTLLKWRVFWWLCIATGSRPRHVRGIREAVIQERSILIKGGKEDTGDTSDWILAVQVRMDLSSTR